MLLAMVAIAAVFLGIWGLAVALESKFHRMGKRKQKPEVALPESSISLISLLIFLFTPTRLINSSNVLKFESEVHRSTD